MFQITQECPLRCDICLRYYEPKSRGLSPENWKHMVNILKKRGLKRLTVTGGEPTILGEKLFDFLKYVHEQQIHTSLSTTGFRLNELQIKEMDEYLDHILISIRSLNIEDWIADFGNTDYSHELFETVINILQWTQNTNILLEVNTVLHKENIDKILDLGQQLVLFNPKIIWRIENYYANGIMGHLQPRFELDNETFEQKASMIKKTFMNHFRDIRVIRKPLKKSSPGFLLTQNGDLMLTSNHRHTSTGFNVLNNNLPEEFNMIRPWKEYIRICRDWGWGDFD